MDQHDRDHNSAQPPAKDFLALTHGQEWVSFYESFDKLVQDHLSRSSELLRRAMSLPEVADREVAQVRAELEGKLAAERDRSHDVLSKLNSEISQSRDHVTTLAATVNDVAAGLTSLSTRVSEALAALDIPAGQTHALAAATEPASEAATPPAETLNAVAAAAPVAPESDAPVAEAATVAQSAVETDEPVAAETEVEAFVAPADAESIFHFDSESELDLTALAEAEAEATEESIDLDSVSDEFAVDAERSQTGVLEDDVVGVSGADRPRPHWLSVTRIGSRP